MSLGSKLYQSLLGGLSRLMFDLTNGNVVPATVRVDSSGNEVGTAASPGIVAGQTIDATATFNTPSGTTAYALGDLIADNATGASVTPLAFTVARVNAGSGMVRRARIKTVDSGFAGATVRLHLYKVSPTCANGDNGAWSTTESTYLGALDVTLDKTFSDPLYKGIGAPNAGSEINFVCGASSQIVYGLIESRGTPTPQGAKAWSVTLEVLQN